MSARVNSGTRATATVTVTPGCPSPAGRGEAHSRGLLCRVSESREVAIDDPCVPCAKRTGSASCAAWSPLIVVSLIRVISGARWSVEPVDQWSPLIRGSPARPARREAPPCVMSLRSLRSEPARPAQRVALETTPPTAAPPPGHRRRRRHGPGPARQPAAIQ